LLIVYATETGNAQDAADYIARQCRRIAFHCRVVSIEQTSLVNSYSVFWSFPRRYPHASWTSSLRGLSSLSCPPLDLELNPAL
jgi:hypothetical protein